jgi:rhamnulokinase
MLHLAFDLGSESGRAVAGKIEGGRLHMEQIHRFRTQSFRTSRHRFRNIYRFYEETLEALRIFAAKRGGTLESLGVDAWGSDIVLLDAVGNIRGLPLFYREYGNFDIDGIVEGSIGWDALYEKTGNQKLTGDTLHQLIYMKHRGDPALSDPRAMLFIADIFHYLLGAPACCEHSNASDSHLFNNNTQEWDMEILNAFGLPEGILTPIRHAGETIGEADRQILTEAGIASPVKIILPAAHDTASAALAVPDPGDDWMYISSGTWSLMGLQTDAPVINGGTKKYYFDNSGMPIKKNMIRKNITGMWIIQQCAEKWPGVSYGEIAARAEAAGSPDCYIDVDDPAFSLSADMPGTIRAKIRESRGRDVDPGDIGQIARICFESLALKYRFVMERLLEATEKKISRIHIIGGGGRNAVLNQFAANATGYPVLSGVYEATAAGNILTQAYGCGEVGGMAEIREIIRNTHPLSQFSPEDSAAWAGKYERFKEILGL